MENTNLFIGKKLNLIYWRNENFWPGKLMEYPEIMTQGETLEELKENIRDAYFLMVFSNIPESYEVQEISL